jgi:hypothetical protein
MGNGDVSKNVSVTLWCKQEVFRSRKDPGDSDSGKARISGEVG